MEWYYYLGAISYGIFIIQTILSFIGIDSDLDVDFDMDGDIDVFGSDIISFKGLIHFAMGFSGWLMITKSTTIPNLCVAGGVGLVFVIVLYLLCKMFMKLSQENVAKEGDDLVGEKVRIVYKTNKHVTDANGDLLDVYNGYIRGMEITCVNLNNIPLIIGSYYTILQYANGIYVVE